MIIIRTVCIAIILVSGVVLAQGYHDPNDYTVPDAGSTAKPVKKTPTSKKPVKPDTCGGDPRPGTERGYNCKCWPVGPRAGEWLCDLSKPG